MLEASLLYFEGTQQGVCQDFEITRSHIMRWWNTFKTIYGDFSCKLIWILIIISRALRRWRGVDGVEEGIGAKGIFFDDMAKEFFKFTTSVPFSGCWHVFASIKKVPTISDAVAFSVEKIKSSLCLAVKISIYLFTWKELVKGFYVEGSVLVFTSLWPSIFRDPGILI